MRISLRSNLLNTLSIKALSNKGQFRRILQKTGKKHVSWHTYGIPFYSLEVHVRPYQSTLFINQYPTCGAKTWHTSPKILFFDLSDDRKSGDFCEFFFDEEDIPE